VQRNTDIWLPVLLCTKRRSAPYACARRGGPGRLPREGHRPVGLGGCGWWEATDAAHLAPRSPWDPGV